MSLENSSDFLLNFSVGDMNGNENRFYEFKSFRLDVAERQLLHNGVSVPLMPKVFDVLAYLVEHSRHLVEKEELMRNVWADTFVEESNIARIIHELRKILGEDKNGNNFIETVAKKGYRFVAEVRKINHVDSESPVQTEETKESKTTPEKIKDENLFARIKRRPIIVLLSAAFFLTLTFLTTSYFYRQNWTFSNPSGKKQSIAILPIRPIGVENREAIYELGITESIIYRLSSASNLIVRPSSATHKYLETDQDPIAVGQEQKVDFVLTSNYQILNGKTYINSQLVNTQNGNIEEVFKSEKEFSVAFQTQEAIALEVGNIILARFDNKKTYQTTRRGTDNEEAYRLYLQANYLIDKLDSKKAIEYLEQAISLDPNYAQAYAGLAWAYFWQGNRVKIKDSIDKALQLDETISEAHSIYGFYKQTQEWDFAGAEKEYLRAIELDPNSSFARHFYALYLAVIHRQFDEALNQVKTGIELDPTSIPVNSSYGDILYFAKRYEDAVQQFKLVLKMYPGFDRTYFWMMKACEMQGDETQAFEFFIKYQTGIKTDEKIIRDYQTIFEKSGFKAVLRESLVKDKRYSPVDTASQYAYLGEKEKAFEYLEKAYTQHDFWTAIIQAEPLFDSLRDDPRFVELLKKVGFPQ